MSQEYRFREFDHNQIKHCVNEWIKNRPFIDKITLCQGRKSINSYVLSVGLSEKFQDFRYSEFVKSGFFWKAPRDLFNSRIKNYSEKVLLENCDVIIRKKNFQIRKPGIDFGECNINDHIVPEHSLVLYDAADTTPNPDRLRELARLRFEKASLGKTFKVAVLAGIYCEKIYQDKIEIVMRDRGSVSAGQM